VIIQWYYIRIWKKGSLNLGYWKFSTEPEEKHGTIVEKTTSLGYRSMVLLLQKSY